MAPIKPKMPYPPPEGWANVRFHLVEDFEHYSNGKLGMVLESSKFTDSETGNIIGEVQLCMGGGMMVQVGNRTWAVNAKDLFLAALHVNTDYKPPK